MSTHHLLVDIGLWLIVVLWLIEFLAKHPGPMRQKRRNRILRAPSAHCERTGDWKVNLPGMAKRQAD